MAGLPAGFVLDQPQEAVLPVAAPAAPQDTVLPAGFALDQPKPQGVQDGIPSDIDSVAPSGLRDTSQQLVPSPPGAGFVEPLATLATGAIAEP